MDNVDAPFQARVARWMFECFDLKTRLDIRERGDRLLEEVLELLQAHGYDQSRVATLRDYVYGRPVGEPVQEVGGVMVTLAAYCLAAEVDMHAAGETELERIWTKIDAIREKQASKRGLHTPLPTPPVHEGQERVASVRMFQGTVETIDGFRVVMVPSNDWQDDDRVTVSMRALAPRRAHPPLASRPQAGEK